MKTSKHFLFRTGVKALILWTLASCGTSSDMHLEHWKVVPKKAMVFSIDIQRLLDKGQFQFLENSKHKDLGLNLQEKAIGFFETEKEFGFAVLLKDELKFTESLATLLKESVDKSEVQTTTSYKYIAKEKYVVGWDKEKVLFLYNSMQGNEKEFLDRFFHRKEEDVFIAHSEFQSFWRDTCDIGWWWNPLYSSPFMTHEVMILQFLGIDERILKEGNTYSYLLNFEDGKIVLVGQTHTMNEELREWLTKLVGKGFNRDLLPLSIDSSDYILSFSISWSALYDLIASQSQEVQTINLMAQLQVGYTLEEILDELGGNVLVSLKFGEDWFPFDIGVAFDFKQKEILESALEKFIEESDHKFLKKEHSYYKILPPGEGGIALRSNTCFISTSEEAIKAFTKGEYKSTNSLSLKHREKILSNFLYTNIQGIPAPEDNEFVLWKVWEVLEGIEMEANIDSGRITFHLNQKEDNSLYVLRKLGKKIGLDSVFTDDKHNYFK